MFSHCHCRQGGLHVFNPSSSTNLLASSRSFEIRGSLVITVLKLGGSPASSLVVLYNLNVASTIEITVEMMPRTLVPDISKG